MPDPIVLIDAKFKAKHRNLTTELGHAPMPRDPGYWDLSGWYAEQVAGLAVTHPRAVREAEDPRETVTDGDGVEWYVHAERKCEVCWEPVRKRVGAAGRWPKRCEGCRT